jgi:A/G-specific adenine glycosylase
MLQQTQVDRVVPKFEAFIQRFPDEKTLAEASLAEILGLWNGLGYNRRAKFLHEAARKIAADFDGDFPDNEADLLQLSGVGKGTAGAILTYAFNQPVVFIETNIRTVYFHHFFADSDGVTDAKLVPIIERTLDREHPREFYWSLMDYGSWLKRQGAGRVSQSKHYKKQSPLKGSVREVRGQIIKQLATNDATETRLREQLNADNRFETALAGLIADGLVVRTGDYLHLTK